MNTLTQQFAKNAQSLLVFAIVFTGLITLMTLIKTSQDPRQQASEESIVFTLKSESASTLKQGAEFALIVEKQPSSLQVTAADFTLEFDPNVLEYTKLDRSTKPFSIVLMEHLNQEAGIVRIAVGKNPEISGISDSKIAVIGFKVKNTAGDSKIKLGLNSQVAAVGYQTNVLTSSSVEPYNFTVIGETTTPTTDVQMNFSFAGTPAEGNGQFLQQAAKSQRVAVSLQNIKTGEITTPTKMTASFKQVATSDPKVGIFSLDTAWKNEEIPTGTYNILIKGPLHQQIRFCKNNQTATDRCGLIEGIAITAQEEHQFEFAARPLSCGDLPISGTNRDKQDGIVRVTDYSFMLSCLGKRKDAACVARADCNSDGSVTNLDMDLLLETLSIAYDQ